MGRMVGLSAPSQIAEDYRCIVRNAGNLMFLAKLP